MKLSKALFIAAGLAAVCPAMAQTSRPMPQNLDDLLQMADLNNDGVIARSEFLSLRHRRLGGHQR